MSWNSLQDFYPVIHFINLTAISIYTSAFLFGESLLSSPVGEHLSCFTEERQLLGEKRNTEFYSKEGVAEGLKGSGLLLLHFSLMLNFDSVSVLSSVSSSVVRTFQYTIWNVLNFIHALIHYNILVVQIRRIFKWFIKSNSKLDADAQSFMAHLL